MDNQAERNAAIQKLAEMIDGIQFAMLTTAEPDGTLRSRPMATQQVEFDGDLWFFTWDESPKTDQVRQDHHVNVSFSEPKRQAYVSMSGMAQVVHDRAKAEELWNPMYKAYFPQGLDDPNLALLKVEVSQAEFWDAPSSKMVHAYRLAKAMLGDESIQDQAREQGENQKLNL